MFILIFISVTFNGHEIRTIHFDSMQRCKVALEEVNKVLNSSPNPSRSSKAFCVEK